MCERSFRFTRNMDRQDQKRLVKFVNKKILSDIKPLRQVGSYQDEVLRITDTNMAAVYSDVETTCDGACLECRYGSLTDESFTFIPGDIIIGGNLLPEISCVAYECKVRM